MGEGKNTNVSIDIREIDNGYILAYRKDSSPRVGVYGSGPCDNGSYEHASLFFASVDEAVARASELFGTGLAK